MINIIPMTRPTMPPRMMAVLSPPRLAARSLRPPTRVPERASSSGSVSGG